jgi:glycosyltransferase involved in cell wall biosynthesis
MKILQLISSAGFYGAESMVVSLAEALSGLGHEVRLAAIRNLQNPNTEVADRARAAGIPSEVISCAGRLDLRALVKLRALINRFAPAIVHTHGYKADTCGLLSGARSRAALVATCHNWTNATTSLRRYAELDRLVLRRFDRVVCVSPEVQQLIVQAGLAASRTCVISNGIDVCRFAMAAPTLERAADTVMIGLVGRLVPEKGFDLALTAASEFLKRHPEAHVVLAGDGPARHELQTLASRVGLNDRVSFLGARADMPGVYRSLDVMVLPSLNEGMPMTVLEAMAAGVPVIATRVGALPDVIHHGENGLLFEPGDAQAFRDAIEHLLSHPGERTRIGLAGQRWVLEKATIRRTAENYVNEYSGLVAQRTYCVGEPAEA